MSKLKMLKLWLFDRKEYHTQQKMEKIRKLIEIRRRRHEKVRDLYDELKRIRALTFLWVSKPVGAGNNDYGVDS